jgi:manganese efflux pump family protein
VSVVALAIWITTAGGGLYLLSIWLIEYDKDFQSAAATRLPPLVLASHVLFAVGGLVVWAAYLFFDDDDLTWVAVAALVMAAILGAFMASRWIGVYRAGKGSAPVAATVLSPAGAAAGDLAGPWADDVDRTLGTSQMELGRRGLGRAGTGPPERNFPLPVVIGHGLFACVTITLVLLVALGVGGS